MALIDKLRGKATGRKPTGKVAALGRLANGGSEPEIPPVAGEFRVNDGPHYLDVLAELHGILRPDWYLEIGTREGRSLALAIGNYVAIDPDFHRQSPPLHPGKRAHFLSMTSDDAFASGFLEREGIRPEFGFLDGMHLSEFLMRDFINYERIAKPGFAVALHDCLPFSHAAETRDDAVIATGKPWTGDVWKVVWWLLQHRPDLKVTVLDAWRSGLVVVEGLDPANTVLSGLYDRFVAEMRDIRLKDFGTDRYFAAFDVHSSSRFIETLRKAKA